MDKHGVFTIEGGIQKSLGKDYTQDEMIDLFLKWVESIGYVFGGTVYVSSEDGCVGCGEVVDGDGELCKKCGKVLVDGEDVEEVHRISEASAKRFTERLAERGETEEYEKAVKDMTILFEEWESKYKGEFLGGVYEDEGKKELAEKIREICKRILGYGYPTIGEWKL